MMQHMMCKNVGVISDEGDSSKTENLLLSLFSKRKSTPVSAGRYTSSYRVPVFIFLMI